MFSLKLFSCLDTAFKLSLEKTNQLQIQDIFVYVSNFKLRLFLWLQVEQHWSFASNT